MKGQTSSHPETTWVSFRASRELKPPKIFQKGKKKKIVLKGMKIRLASDSYQNIKY